MIPDSVNHGIQTTPSSSTPVKGTFFYVFLLCILISFFPLKNVVAEDLNIGMSAAFKGPTGGLGTELYRGSMAYLDYINSLGGVQWQKDPNTGI